MLGQSEELAANQTHSEETIAESKEMIKAADAAIDKIDLALPTVRDLDASDSEMDEIAALAQSTFTDLVDLSMNVEPRFSGPILQSASTLLGHALTAKMAKMDKKLKMVDLQLKKARLDQAERNAPSASPVEKAAEGEGIVVDRNELLRSILANSVKNDK